MMITVEQIEKSRKMYQESIKMLKASLYDENGNLYDSKFFGGGEKDRQSKINSLKYYEEQLKALDDIDKCDPIYGYGLALKKKEIPVEIQKKIELAKQEGPRAIKFNDGTTVPAVHSFIQYPDSSYHDTYILYKGYSQEYNTEFMVYLDGNQIMYTPIIIKDGNIMKNPEHSKEMIAAFEKQFVSQKTNLSSLLNNPSKLLEHISSFPTSMACSTVDQYESVEVPIVIGRKIPPKYQTQVQYLQPESSEITNSNNSEPPMPPKNDHQTIITPPKPPIVSEKKQIFTKKMHRVICNFEPKGYLKDKKDYYEEFVGRSGFFVLSTVRELSVAEMRANIAGIKNVSEDEYKKLKKSYSCSVSNLIVNENEINDYIQQLSIHNHGVDIDLYKDDSGAYRIVTAMPINELKFNNLSFFGIDKDGYIVKKSHSIVKTNYDKTKECYPFVDESVGKFMTVVPQNDSEKSIENQMSTATSQNNIQTPNKTHNSVSNNLSSDDSNVVTNVSNKNDNSKKQQEEASIGELLEIIERMTKQQLDYESLNRKAMNTLYGHMQSMQKLINQQQQQIELLTKNLMALQGNQMQSPMNENSGKSL